MRQCPRVGTIPLAALLCVQAVLLLAVPGLLPLWGDELFTVRTVVQPFGPLVRTLANDIHPPLYFLLLHEWAKLPLPWTGIGALRVFSGLWGLAATLLLDRFWIRNWEQPARWTALALFAFSPCLLLYGRMARSYSMQAALVLVAVAAFERWGRNPRSAALALGAWAALLCLLYTHYAPGIALLAGLIPAGWRKLGATRISAFLLATAAGYAPWILHLAGALDKWKAPRDFSAHYTLSGSVLFEPAVKLGFGAVSFAIGESFAALSLLLVPVFWAFAILGLRSKELARGMWWLGVSALAGYIGVARWVSYPFLPARLLWLLPFLVLAAAAGIAQISRPAVRNGILALIAVSYLSSHILYFRRENFLNLGYVAPLSQIAGMINASARPNDLISLDGYNTDYSVLLSQLSGRTPAVILTQGTLAEARARMVSAPTVWIVRNTRDVSPGRMLSAFESEACAGRRQSETLLEPFAGWQRTAMRVAGFNPVPTHFYRVTECGLAVSTPGR